MTSMIRLCFLKFPPNKIENNIPFEFSLTICNDLGVCYGSIINNLELNIKLIEAKGTGYLNKVLKSTKNGIKPFTRNQYVDEKVKLKILEPKKGFVKADLDGIVYKLTAGTEYLEWSFKAVIEVQDKGLDLNYIQLLFSIDNKDNDVILPGGIIKDNICFLNLFSGYIEIDIANSKTKTLSYKSKEIIPNEKEPIYCMRYFEFSNSLKLSLFNDAYIKVVELPFGKDLGSHCWDCSWVGLDFLCKLIFSPSQLLDDKEFIKVENKEAALLLRNRFFEDKVCNIIELGCGCSLLGLGLSFLLNQLDNINAIEKSKTKQKLYKNNKTKYNIILSDTESVLQATKRNIHHNTTKERTATQSATISELILDWLLPIPSHLNNQDLIFCFDVVYNNCFHIPLFTVLCNLVKSSIFNGGKKPIIVLGYKLRNREVEKGFFDLLIGTFDTRELVDMLGVKLFLLIPC